jgi:hypothetical protein
MDVQLRIVAPRINGSYLVLRIVAAYLSVNAAAPAWAAGTRYRFAGKSDLTHESEATAPWPAPAAPQAFAGSFVYDPTNLVAPLAEFTVTFAGQTVELPTPQITLYDDALELSAWRGMMFQDNFPGEVSGELMFVDRDSSKLSASELPAELALADFDGVEFLFDAQHDSCPLHPTAPCATAQEIVLQHRGSVVTLSAIPEPGSALLSATGLAFALLRRRRKTK